MLAEGAKDIGRTASQKFMQLGSMGEQRMVSPCVFCLLQSVKMYVDIAEALRQQVQYNKTSR